MQIVSSMFMDERNVEHDMYTLKVQLSRLTRLHTRPYENNCWAQHRERELGNFYFSIYVELVGNALLLCHIILCRKNLKRAITKGSTGSFTGNSFSIYGPPS